MMHRIVISIWFNSQRTRSNHSTVLYIVSWKLLNGRKAWSFGQFHMENNVQYIKLKIIDLTVIKRYKLK